jgi:hypothetical protein
MGGNLDVRLEDGNVGLAPAAGASFGLVVTTEVNDAVAPAAAETVDAVAFTRTAAGVTAIAGAAQNIGKVGTAALIAGAFAVTYAVTAHNTVQVTITPPAAYPNPLNAVVNIAVLNG